ncbi:MAG: hypothetical protein ACXWDM_02030 [Nocardioides sp.]
MSTDHDVQWGKWVGAVVAVFVFLKSAAFVFARLWRLARNEVEARGGDVAFVLGLAERRKGGGAQGGA